jgi:hypothetical protein
MNSNKIFIKTISVVLIAIMASIPITLLGQEKNDYFSGKIDGERDGKAAGASAGWYFIGCASPMWAYVLEPDVPSAGALMGKSSEYIQGYNEGYKKAVRGERTKKAWYGCIAGGVIYCGFYAILIAGASTTTSSSTY